MRRGGLTEIGLGRFWDLSACLFVAFLGVGRCGGVLLGRCASPGTGSWLGGVRCCERAVPSAEFGAVIGGCVWIFGRSAVCS